MTASDEAERWFRQGVTLGEQGHSAAALSLLRRAVGSRPDFAEAHAALGDVLRDTGDAEGAAAAWRRALALNGAQIAPLNNLATSEAAHGGFAEAATLLRRAIALAPELLLLRLNLSDVLLRKGEAGTALVEAEQAVALAPHVAQAQWVRANALRALGRRADAIAGYRQALACDAQHIGSLSHLADLLADGGGFDEAAALAERALELQPTRASLHYNLGTIRNRQGRGAEALAAFDRAVVLAPENASYHVNRGIALRQAGRLDDSVAAFDRALQLRTDDPLAHWNRALSLLGLGRLAEGWREYEWRRRLAGAAPAPALPEWDGAAPRRVLVRREQGLGDEILFASCLPDALARALALTVECDARLAPLFQRSFPTARIVPLRRPAPGEPEPLSVRGDAEAWVAAGSLPRLYRPTLAAFPERRGFLVADADALARWKAWLGQDFAVGLCWRSSQAGGARDQRYAMAQDLQPLLAVPGVRFVSLQLGLTDDERKILGGAEPEAPGLDLRDDIDGTAALIAALDLVITVDSWVLSLAGALGTRTWFLASQRDWATLGAGRVPWLPAVTARFVEAGGWPAAIRAAAGDLTRLATAR